MNLPPRSFKLVFSNLCVIAAWGLLSVGLSGCASTPELTLTSITNGHSYHQGFVQAYTSRNENGDTDVVLVDEATEQQLAGQPDSAAVRQVMHFRIIWTPTADMKGTASNSVVKWYVIGHAQQHLIEYVGTAFVSMSQDDDGCTLSVRNAVLKPSATHASLTDPVGLSRLEGKFTARANAAKVNQVLGDLKTAVAAARASIPALSAITPDRATER